jgi:hypothetical protein
MINPYRVIIKNGIWYRVPAHLAVVKEELRYKTYMIHKNIFKDKNKDETVKDRESSVSAQVHCSI